MGGRRRSPAQATSTRNAVGLNILVAEPVLEGTQFLMESAAYGLPTLALL